MNIVLLISSPNIPLRAGRLVRNILGSKCEISECGDPSEAKPTLLTEILVRELPYHTLFRSKKDIVVRRNTSSEVSPLYQLTLRFDEQIPRAKVTYVREFHTVRGMNSLRRAKPDLLVDLDADREIHPLVIESSRLGLLKVIRVSDEVRKEKYQALLIKPESAGDEVLLTSNKKEGIDQDIIRRSLYLAAIALLSSR